VEQVTTLVLEGPARRFARIRRIEIKGVAVILVFLIWQLLHWLLFGCRNSQRRPGDLLAKGSLAMLPALTGGCTNRAIWAAEPLLCQIR
jgi:hypothetical protein